MKSKNKAKIKKGTKAKKSPKVLLGKKKVSKKKLQKKIKKAIAKKVAKKPKFFRTLPRQIPHAFAPTGEFSPESFFKAKIKVIGVGGGGSSIVSEIGRSLHKATFVTADTDVRAFKKDRESSNFCLVKN